MRQKHGAVTLGSRNRFSTLACLLSLGLIFLLPGPPDLVAANPPLKRHDYSLPRMGTIFASRSIRERAEASKAAEVAFTRAEELEQIMSDYRPDSELMHPCRAKAPQRRFRSAATFMMCWTNRSGLRAFRRSL